MKPLIDSKIPLKNAVAGKVSIPMFGLGTWQITENDVEPAVIYALKQGYRHFDSAKIYENEKELGEALRKGMKQMGIKRNEIFITTKIWNFDQSDPLNAFNESFEKLNLEYIDLYLIHWPVMQRIETWKKLTGLLNEKKTRVKALGVSNFEIEHIEEIKKGKLPLPSVNQIEFSPFLYRKNLLDYCKKHGIIVEAYSPLTRGKRLSDPRIETIAKKHEKTPAQILLRWALQHNTVIIPKSSNPEHIKENSEIFDFALSKEDMNILDSFGGAYYSIINPDLLGILFSVATRLRNLFS